MKFKPLLALTWLVLAASFAAVIWITAPRDENVHQLIGFGIGMAFWGSWKLGKIGAP